MIPYEDHDSFILFNLNEFVTTQTEDRAIAAEANIGLSMKPRENNAPAANGMPITL